MVMDLFAPAFGDGAKSNSAHFPRPTELCIWTGLSCSLLRHTLPILFFLPLLYPIPKHPSIMSSELYSLAEVLAVAKVHPFYVPEIQYPPKPETVKTIREDAKNGAAKATLGSHKLLYKKDL